MALDPPQWDHIPQLFATILFLYINKLIRGYSHQISNFSANLSENFEMDLAPVLIESGS
jgi:hypothetical protein